MFSKEYAKYYDLFNKDKLYKKEIDFIYKWAERPRNILDICCGTANYWEFFPKNTRIVGIEKSKDMIQASGKGEEIFPLDAVFIRELDFVSDFDLATALFDAVNYIPSHNWWKDIPIKAGGFFIFDIFDKEKIRKEGFKKTSKVVGDITRTITPLSCNGDIVNLEVDVQENGLGFQEHHMLYLYSEEDINKFCGEYFEIEEIKKTKTWQVWYKLRKR